MQLILNALNGKQLFYPGPREAFGDYGGLLRETPAELRKIVNAWLACGPDFERFRQQHSKIWEDVNRYWQKTPTALVAAEVGGGAAIALCAEPGRDPYEEALRFFVWLITNRDCGKLAGPCARCGAYYIKKRALQKVYCSRKCGNAATATVRTRERQQEQHEDKLRQAAKAAREWSETKTKLDWKQWVARRCKKSSITPKFLTRAVNKGELRVPVHR